MRELDSCSSRVEWFCQVDVVGVRLGGRRNDVRVGAVNEGLELSTRVSQGVRRQTRYNQGDASGTRLQVQALEAAMGREQIESEGLNLLGWSQGKVGGHRHSGRI